ncbi:MAG: hypothetical protein U1A78_40535 [Polyangia bacterium]
MFLGMPKCFVIQPFDRGKFDKRYDDVFGPAIKDAGLEPYRVDRDPSVTIPIEDIEKNIRDSDICLADISLNNPNVWYEVGYALASRKEVILTCCKTDRTEERFPFDIQHRRIITYVSESPSDFKRLQQQISEQLKTRLEKNQEIQALVSMGNSPAAAGLLPHEVAVLVAISAETVSNLEDVAVNLIRHSLEQAGFTSGALGLGVRRLARLRFIEKRSLNDENGDPYYVLSLTGKGEEWLMDNLDKVPLKKQNIAPPRRSKGQLAEADDIPF